MVVLLLWLEQRSRGRRAYTQAGKAAPLPRLAGRRGRLAGRLRLRAGADPGFRAALRPVVGLGRRPLGRGPDADFLGHVANSLLLALLAAGLVALTALLLSYAARREPSRWTWLWSRLATLGYAVPGTVLAVGVFVPIAWLDNRLLDWLRPGWRRMPAR